jgi:Ran GTPase-activating protein (RanGAP) involved in mRNA processing and transport
VVFLKNKKENKISSKGIQKLKKGLIKNETLTEINFYMNLVSDEASETINEILKENKKIEKFNLKGGFTH